MNVYAVCAQCDFGIEINRDIDGNTGAEFHHEEGDKQWCYYCYKLRQPRSIPQLKSLLADSKVLLASARRVSDLEAIAFYNNQIQKARAALNFEAPVPKPQGNLF